MAKISAYSAITNVQPNDLLVAVDVHDTTEAPTGTTKNMTLSQLGSFQPWQFLPESYGAAGNGKIIGDGVINGTTTFTSASAGFTSADTGKHIMINGGQGTTSPPLITTITFVNSTTVTLGTGASASASGVSAIYGTDDTTAVNSCVSAAAVYAEAGNYEAQIVLSAKLYCLASGPTQSGDGATTPTFNSQVPLPYPNANGTTRKLVLNFLGVGDAASCQYFEASIPNIQGSALVSMVLAPSSGGSATYGAQSVIGGPSAGSGSGAFGFTGGFANVLPAIDGVTLVVPWGAQQLGFDFRFVGGMSVPNASVQTFAATAGNHPLLSDTADWANTNATGLYAPVALNNDDVYVGQFTAENIAGPGVAFAEHFTAQKLTVISCDIGAYVAPHGGTPTHGASILYFSCENTHYALQCGTASNTQFPIFIGLMDTEVIDTADITDSSNLLTGLVHWADYERTAMNVTGALNLVIVNDRLAPGVWSGAPAAPTEAVAQQNTAYREALIYVTSSAAITAIAVGSTSGSLTTITESAAIGVAVTVKVPSGWWYSVTSATGTLTTNWVLS